MFQAEIVEKIRTHFIFSNFFPKMVPFITMWGDKKKTAAIPLQQCLRESATVLRYTHTAFLLYDDEVKEAVQKWLYEPTENVIRHREPLNSW